MRRRGIKTYSAYVLLLGAAVIVPRLTRSAEDCGQTTPPADGCACDADCAKQARPQPDGARGKAKRPTGEPERKLTAQEP